jgi:hypothetical protein
MATAHGFKWSKKGSASLEKMTTVTGTKVTYSKDPTCSWDVMERGPEVTLTPGQSMTIAGKTGVATTCQCDLLPGTYEDGAGTGYDVWETTATLELDTLTV